MKTGNTGRSHDVALGFRFCAAVTMVLIIVMNYFNSGLAIKKEASTLHLLGIVYYHSNRLTEAESTWKECLELDPKDTQTRSNLVSSVSSFTAVP